MNTLVLDARCYRIYDLTILCNSSRADKSIETYDDKVFLN